MYDLTSAGSQNSSNTAVDTAQLNALASLEAKLFRSNEKLKICEEKCKDLTTENGQIDVLRDTLRDRNNNIKDLKRSLEEKEKNKNIAPEDSDELRLKIVDLMRENKTLKQALSAATMGSKQGSTERIGK